MSFNFGATPKTTPEFTLATTQPPVQAGGFSLAVGSGDNLNDPNKAKNLLRAPAKTSAPSFSFGSPSTTAPTLNFGVPGAPALSLTTSSASSTTSAPVAFASILPTSTAAASFAPKVGATTITTTASKSTGFTLGTASTTVPASAAPPKLSFGLTPTTTSLATSLSLGATSTAPTLSLGTTTTTTSIAPATSTTASVPATAALNFGQLEDSINKWTIDLEEQGKFFINQAKQLNAWDSLLISNGEKILNLNSSIERVKQQQTQLDQELDFVLAQQKELEELITPLEKELLDIPVADIDRNQMYQLSEILDSQLKQMTDDLKEIIEHINESHKEEELSNPIMQISRILNAHMNSLQWIDRNTTQISTQLEQINKMQDMNRRNLSLNHSFKNF